MFYVCALLIGFLAGCLVGYWIGKHVPQHTSSETQQKPKLKEHELDYLVRFGWVTPKLSWTRKAKPRCRRNIRTDYFDK